MPTVADVIVSLQQYPLGADMVVAIPDVEDGGLLGMNFEPVRGFVQTTVNAINEEGAVVREAVVIIFDPRMSEALTNSDEVQSERAPSAEPEDFS